MPYSPNNTYNYTYDALCELFETPSNRKDADALWKIAFEVLKAQVGKAPIAKGQTYKAAFQELEPQACSENAASKLDSTKVITKIAHAVNKHNEQVDSFNRNTNRAALVSGVSGILLIILNLTDVAGIGATIAGIIMLLAAYTLAAISKKRISFSANGLPPNAEPERSTFDRFRALFIEPKPSDEFTVYPEKSNVI